MPISNSNLSRCEVMEKYFGERQFAKLREYLVDTNVVDAAQVMDDLSASDAALFYRMLPKNMSADVFSYLSSEAQENLIESLTDDEVSRMINELYIDDTVDLIEEMPANVVKKILLNSNRERRDTINKLLIYPEDSAGSIMTVEMVRLRRSWNVAQALSYIRKNGANHESIYTCYVTNESAVLEGVISVRDLLCNPDETLIEDLMYPEVISVKTTDDQELASQLLHKYDFIALPVVDAENRLVGIITIDDALDVMQDEATEDMERMAAMSPSEKPYLKMSIPEHAKKRIFWLLILMISGMVNGSILNNYENAFVAIPILVSFIPVLTDTGGNSGSQTSTLIIRGMVIGELDAKNIFQILWKELCIALICGTILAVVNGIRIYYFMNESFTIALTVSLAMIATVVIAKLIGATLPIIAKSLRMDPAIMAAPLITTIVDAASLIIYFKLANIFLLSAH